jgi:hypothetical protein
MIKNTTPFLVLACLLADTSARSQTILTEGFDDVSGLAGNGWIFENLSDPIGFVPWRQGLTIAAYGGSHSGDSTSFAESTLDAVEDNGTISNWMITPAMTLMDGDSVVFWTLAYANESYPDRLEVRLSSNGGADPGQEEYDVGDFTTLLLTINPLLNTTDYPSIGSGDTWTRFGMEITGLGVPTSCRVAFRHWVTNAGFLADNSTAIGIDDVEVFQGASTGLMEAAGAGPQFVQNHDQLHVIMPATSGSSTVMMMNATGQAVSATRFSGSATLDLAGQASGLYVLVVQDASTGRWWRERVVKR